MTKRLSNALKKKLELSLTSLTPRQAGRLFLIYSNEYHESNPTDGVWEYPPIKELADAWDKQVKAAKAKGGPIEEEAVAAYNGFMALTNLIKEANRIADSDLWRLYAIAISQGSVIDRLLLEDSYSDITRVLISQFTEDAPRPLSWEDYEKAAEWYEGYSTVDLEELANELTGEYTRRQGYEILEVPEDFLKKISTPEVEYGGEDEEVRRKWVESQGEAAILKKYFAGDKYRFEAWKQFGGYPEFNGREWDTMADEINDRLVDKVISGDLEGGVCFGLENHWEFVPALNWDRQDPDKTGQLCVPAWNALRSIWTGWLYDKGIFRGDEKRVDKDSPDVMETYYSIEGTLQADQITVKAKEFYLDCQKKPWGGDLIDADKVDFVALGRVLCADASPLMGYYAPDLGTVNVKDFHEAEGDDPFMGSSDQAGEAWYYATIRGLRGIADEFGTRPNTIEKNLVKEFYYPTDDPQGKRGTISDLLRRMGQLRTSHRPISWKEKNKRDISSFLGQKFYSPLEEAIRDIGGVFDDVETFKLTYDLISQEFFEGIPVLAPILRDRLEGIEKALKVTEDGLNHFIDLLSHDFWNVDTSSLHLVKKGPAVDWSRVMAGAIIYTVDDEKDQKRFPVRLDDGETLESVTRKMTGMDYAGITAAAMKGNRGTK